MKKIVIARVFTIRVTDSEISLYSVRLVQTPFDISFLQFSKSGCYFCDQSISNGFSFFQFTKTFQSCTETFCIAFERIG